MRHYPLDELRIFIFIPQGSYEPIMVNFQILVRCGIGGACLAALSASAQSLQSFVPVTPCRPVDTRLANGPFGGPSMTAGSTRNFLLPASNCNLPANAAAYSINVTLVPAGSVSYLTIWPAGSPQPYVSTVNDFTGLVIANAAIVPAGVNGAVSVFVTDTTNVVIDVNGYFVSNTDASDNTALGRSSLPASSGAQNTGIGFASLGNNAGGNDNTAVGSTALSSNTTGNYNTALGQSALAFNSTGSDNTAIGYQALSSSTGSDNIGIGFQAGINLGTGNNNIEIGSPGVNGENSVLRIGTSQTKAFLAGVNGNNVTGAAAVFVDANGQLGIQASSRRFKQDIQPMADASSRLMQLEPVIFRYKETAADVQYGLIAEQVAAVYPELAVYDKDGQVETLQYQQLPAMLLNEIQKQHRTIEDLQARIAVLEQLLKATAPISIH